jgi:hypothetical protein
MAQEFILRENVLSNNVLVVADKGKIFKGGYIAIIKEYSFQNAWSDKETVKRFRSEKSLNSYLNKNYKGLDLDIIL